jgi:hypothetical protein
MSDTMEPTVTVEDIFEGREFEETPPGTYRMALKTKNLRIRKTAKGDKKLELFLVHADDDCKAIYKGVNGFVMLTGTDKNGKALRRQFAQFLVAAGISKESLFEGSSLSDSVKAIELDDLDSADWKGVPARVEVRGEPIDLEGVELMVKVEANEYQGKTRTRAAAFYPIS